MKIIKIHKPSDCMWRDSDFCRKADQIHSDCLDDNKFPKDCPLDDYDMCPKPPNGVVCTWKEIAKYTPFGESRLRKRFGQEMLDMAVVWKDNMGKRKGKAIYGFVWKIQRFFYLKGQAGEL